MPCGLVGIGRVTHSEYSILIYVAVVFEIYYFVTTGRWVDGYLPLLPLRAHIVFCCNELRHAAGCVGRAVREIFAVIHYIICTILDNLRRKNIGAIVIILFILGNKLTQRILHKWFHVHGCHHRSGKFYGTLEIA